MLIGCVICFCCNCSESKNGYGSNTETMVATDLKSETINAPPDSMQRKHVVVVGRTVPTEIKCSLGDRLFGVFFVRGKIRGEGGQDSRICFFEISYQPEVDKVLKIEVQGGGEAELELIGQADPPYILLELQARENLHVEPRLKFLEFASDIPSEE